MMVRPCVCVCVDFFFAAATNLMFMTKIDVGQDLAVAIELTRGFSNLLLFETKNPPGAAFGKGGPKTVFSPLPVYGACVGVVEPA